MKCWNCNSEVIWQDDFNSDDYGLTVEGSVTLLKCSNCNCNARYEVFIPTYENLAYEKLESLTIP